MTAITHAKRYQVGRRRPMSIADGGVLFHTRHATCNLAMVLAAACAAPPERVPPPGDGARAHMERLASELASCCSAGAEDRMADALAQVADYPPPEEVVGGLAASLARVAGGRRLNPDTARQVSEDLYAVVNGGYLQRPDLDRRLNRLERTLQESGGDRQAAAALRGFAARAARESRSPRTDWW